MSKISQKINFSSIQVLKTFKVLLQGNYSMPELIKILNQDEKNAIFNNSVISKYINTCRFIGIDIPKINNKYFIASLPFGLDLSVCDLDIVEELSNAVQHEISHKNKTVLEKFLSKLSRFTNKNIAKIEKQITPSALELFERAIAKKRKVKLIFKNQNTLEAIPIKIVESGEKILYSVFYKKVRMIDSSKLCGLEITEKKYIEPYNGDHVTIFNLYGKLAKRYEPHENETIEKKEDGSITVTNRNENKDILFSRLLRYQECCEILKPKIYRDEFKQLIDDTLQNYGV